MDTVFSKSGESHSNRTNSEVIEATLSPFMIRFLSTWEASKRHSQEAAESTIRVSDVIGSVAHLYERIRNVIEYKGEHVLRRNAIERILKRLLWEREGYDTERIAQVLTRELIWARYIPNDTLPSSQISSLATIIRKYQLLEAKIAQMHPKIAKNRNKEWLWGVASCEIEESLDPSGREALVTLMYEWFTTYYRWKDSEFAQAQKQLQIYIAIHRALAKSDNEIIRFHLLIKAYPNWREADDHMINAVAQNFNTLIDSIENQTNFSQKLKLYRIIKKHVAPFEILKEFLQQKSRNFKPTLLNDELFENEITQICKNRYEQIQKKVNRGTIRSIIYIFISKVLFALLLEIPYELWRLGGLTPVPLAINIAFPPAMMLIVGLTIKTPGGKNTERILNKLRTIVYTQPQINVTSFSLARKKQRPLLMTIFAGIYFLLFLFVFGGITWLLFKLHFTIVGVAIFFIFVSLVLLFGYRVRFTASELKMTADQEGVLEYLFNQLSMPFLSAGVYLSQGLAKLNFFTIIFDFLIEAPLKSIIEVIEEWTSFMREKREEVVEVPE